MKFIFLTLYWIISAQATTPGPATEQRTTTRPASIKDAKRIVFLIDSQIHYLVNFPKMRDELCSAVNNLRSDQFFTIIVLRPHPPLYFHENFVRADRLAKSEARDFILTLQPEDKIQPSLGIRRVKELNPDLLCLIVGDKFPQEPAIAESLRSFHGRLNVTIFSSYMPHPNEFLRSLALEHGGTAVDQLGRPIPAPQPPNRVPVPTTKPSVFEQQ